MNAPTWSERRSVAHDSANCGGTTARGQRERLLVTFSGQRW